jgi:hypothetical protein
MTYPQTPGYKDNDTSREMAIKLTRSGKADIDRAIVADFFRSHRMGFTPDEAWQSLGGKVKQQSCRSRISELKNAGLLVKTKERGLSAEGNAAARFYWADYYSQPVTYSFQQDGQGALFA